MSEKKEIIELKDEELKKAIGGNFEEDRGIVFSDNCHFKPSRFVDACDPDYWSFSECARCVYNSTDIGNGLNVCMMNKIKTKNNKLKILRLLTAHICGLLFFYVNSLT